MEDGKIVETVFSAVEDAGLSRDDVVFIYLFGSYVERPEDAEDIDVCVSLDSGSAEDKEYVLKGHVPDVFDLSVFESLPLQVRKSVFEGRLLYSRDERVYDKAFETFRDFESFEPFYKKAIGG